MIAYSAPLVLNAIGWWVNSASDRYVVTWLCGLAVNGIYSVGYKIPSIINVFQTIFNQAWFLSAVKEFDPQDKDGFFITPNGSFWDPDGVYFNKEGYDKHGGRYDSEGEYIPGEGWNKKNNCYESEIEDYDEFDEQENDYGNNINKMDDDDNLDDDVFESDFKFNEPNFQKFFEGMKLDDNDNIEENKDKDNNENKEEDNKNNGNDNKDDNEHEENEENKINEDNNEDNLLY